MRAQNMTIGILAHVDAGKTTLSESILYATGAIRRQGRVDHQDAFLDTDSMEKKRGITIFSKLARFTLGGRQMTLLDTPGHVDFSPEMERTLRVLDAAVLVISAPVGVNAQVRTLWKLLSHYKVPTFLFVNKMDQVENGSPEHDQAQRQLLLDNIQREFGSGVVLFGKEQLNPSNEESVAVLDEALMERLLNSYASGTGLLEQQGQAASGSADREETAGNGGRAVSDSEAAKLVGERKLFPLYFGAALENRGTKELLEGIRRFLPEREYPEDFGALVYKVTRDEGSGGARLVWMKLTGGEIHVRDTVRERNHQDPQRLALQAGQNAAGEDSAETPESVEEKIAGIRLYSGSRYTAVTSAGAGQIVAVTGLSAAQTGDGLGQEETKSEELLSPIMTCRVIPDPGTDTYTLLRALHGLEEEEPMLHVLYDEETRDVTVQIMGQVQTQILQSLILERYGLHVTFGPGSIVYRETIRRAQEGVGHFEPLRHYAEVHLLLEPLPAGSGLVFDNACPPNTLDKNWQNLVMTHLQERTFRGVLTGSDITDMKITLIGGRASKKHTSGGDFRQATYRALRQGLMMAQNILLEPVLSFRLEVPRENLGRALTDIALMQGKAEPAVITEEMAVVEGTVPAQTLGEYAQEVAGYTGGRGRLQVSLKDYEPCHNAREVIEEKGYDPEEDRRNPSSSVFCSHGAGTVVPWQHVRSWMHLDTGWRPAPEEPGENYLTDDYYTFSAADAGADGSGGMAGEGGDGEENTPSGEDTMRNRQNRNTHAGRHGKAQDFAERMRAQEASEKELRSIFEATYGPWKPVLHHPDNERYYSGEEAAVAGPEGGDPKYAARQQKREDQRREPVTEYLLVDGYNIIFAWQELRDLAKEDIKAARDRLLDILSNYAGYARQTVIVVFDAYRVPGGRGEVYHWNNLDVVFTKEAETADLYIEKTAHSLAKKHRVMVATSDAVEQVIIYGSGALRMSARGLLERILLAEEEMHSGYITEDTDEGT